LTASAAWLRWTSIAAGLLAVAVPPGARADPVPVNWIDSGTPLKVRNLAPVTQLYGLPWALGALPAPGTGELALVVEHANNFAAKSVADTTVEFDGSTTVSSFTWQYSLGERFEWGVMVPFVHHGGGFTDGFIEGYHELFGFPDGERDAVSRNRLVYRVELEGEDSVLLDDSSSDLGDARGWLGYRLYDGINREAAARIMVKAPTGDLQAFSGSGATDVSAWVELTDRHTLSTVNLTATMMAGVTRLGHGDLAAADQNEWVPTGHFGLHYPVGRRVTLRAQLDAHGDVIDSPAKELGGASLQGTLGGSVALSRSSWMALGVTEDLSGAGAPDVVFLLTLGAQL
jgi:hypothetical protein